MCRIALSSAGSESMSSEAQIKNSSLNRDSDITRERTTPSSSSKIVAALTSVRVAAAAEAYIKEGLRVGEAHTDTAHRSQAR